MAVCEGVPMMSTAPSTAGTSTSTTSITTSSRAKTLDSIRLKPSMVHNLNKLYRAPLDRLNTTFGVVTKLDRLPIKPAMEKEARAQKANVMILLASRRSGWGNCRENAELLAQLAAHDRRVGLVGVLKDAGEDDAHVLEFRENHFRNYPLYLDEKWYVYKALGKRTLTLDVLKEGAMRLMPRYKRKNIPMRFEGGDRFVMGGVLIFDRKGNLRFTYEEEYGEELDMNVIGQAIAEIRGNSDSSSSSDLSSSKHSISSLGMDDHRFM